MNVHAPCQTGEWADRLRQIGLLKFLRPRTVLVNVSVCRMKEHLVLRDLGRRCGVRSVMEDRMERVVQSNHTFTRKDRLFCLLTRKKKGKKLNLRAAANRADMTVSTE